MPRAPKSKSAPIAVGDFGAEPAQKEVAREVAGAIAAGFGSEVEYDGHNFVVQAPRIDTGYELLGGGPLAEVADSPTEGVYLAGAPEGAFTHTVEWSAPRELSITIPDDGSSCKVYAPGVEEPVFVWPPPAVDIANTATDEVCAEQGYARLPEGPALLALCLADPTVAFKVYDAVKSGAVKAAKWRGLSAGRYHLETVPNGGLLGVVVTALSDPRRFTPEWGARGEYPGPDSDLATAKKWIEEKAAAVGYPVMG